jgi:ABC-2 type transport system permease protein
LTRASWYQAKSYRLSLVMQMVGMLMTVVPIYFIANALQPTMAGAIATEADEYFAFMLVGMMALMFTTGASTILQGTISGGISTGYFESLLMTRTAVPWLLTGLTSYGFILTVVRAIIMITAGWLLGAHIAWGQAVPAALIVIGLFVVHWGIGLVAAALVIAFRTAGPLTNIVATLSIFFGGVYYPVSAIPSWLKNVAAATPLAYGLRALRRVLLQGEDLAAVASDLSMLVAMGVITLIVGAWAMKVSLGYARRAGTLSTY